MSTNKELTAIKDFLLRFLCWAIYAGVLIFFLDSHPGSIKVYGISLKDFLIEDLIALFLSLVIITVTSPKYIYSAQDLFVHTCMLLIILPSSVVCLLSSAPNMPHLYYIAFIAITCFIMLVCRAKSTKKFYDGVISSSLGYSLAIFLVSILAVEFYIYRNSISLTNLNEVYMRRFLNAPKTLLFGHLQLLAGFVIPSILFAIGLNLRNATFVLIALSGFFASFLIAGHKAALVYPIFITFLYLGLRLNFRISTSTLLQLLFISCVLFLTSLPIASSAELPTGFIVRVFLMPSIALKQSYLVANELGYTYFSQINYLHISVPTYQAQPYWPQLDLMLGEFLGYGNHTGFNVNMFANGLISLGLLGVALFTFLAMAYFWLYDYLTEKFMKSFSLALVFPFMMVLHDIPINTFLTSFGGIFLIAFVFIASTRRDVKTHG